MDLSIVMQQFTRPGSLCYTSHWKKTCWTHSVQSQLAKSVTSSPLNKFQLSHGPTRGRPTNTSKVTMIPQGPVSSIRKILAIYHFLKITVLFMLHHGTKQFQPSTWYIQDTKHKHEFLALNPIRPKSLIIWSSFSRWSHITTVHSSI